MASKKIGPLFLPRAGTLMRAVADTLTCTKGKTWWSPEDSKQGRCARALREQYGWPIEDRMATGEKYYQYRLDPERRAHYRFGS